MFPSLHEQPRKLVTGEEHILPQDWIGHKNAQQEAKEKDLLDLPLQEDGSHFEIDALYPDQQFIAFKVISKLKEFMSCCDFSTFKPLRCTLVGQAGTGKSILLKTVISHVRRLFCNSDVVKVAAPTGVAAFNAGGETLHRLVRQGIDKKDYQANTLPRAEKDKLLMKFCDLLVLVIDERSMMPSTLFGTACQIVSETVYGGAMQQLPESFGGIPVVMIAGDDYQLNSQYQGAIDCLRRNDGGKMTEKGRQCFKECAQTVFQLSTSRRLSDKKEQDREIMEALRVGENVKDAHVKKLLSLHLDNIKDLHGPELVEELKASGIYLFWTNDKRIQHNMKMLVAMNTPSNPTAVIKTQTVSSKYAKSSNPHFKSKYPTTALLCKDAKIALQGCNFQPLWGLHNGACGYVKEIVFNKGESPNNNNLPAYVVCDFPLYCGPVWDVNNPTVSSSLLVLFQTWFRSQHLFLFCPVLVSIPTPLSSMSQFPLSKMNASSIAALVLSFPLTCPLLVPSINSKA